VKVFRATVIASLLFTGAEPALGQRTNLSFETPSAEDPQRPRDWKFFGGGHEVALDSSARDGERSLRLVRNRAGGSSAVSQILNLAGLDASRVRLSGHVRTVGVTGGTAGLVMIVWGSGPEPLYTESMIGTGARDTQDWTRYDIELPIPRDAVRVQFGAAFNGAGTAWFDGLEIEVMTDTSISEPVRAYLERALDLMQTHSMRRDSINWPAFRADAWARARGAQRVAALHPVLAILAGKLGDGHSHFSVPGWRQTSERLSPAGELSGDRVGYLRVPGFGGSEPKESTAYADALQSAIRRLDARGVCGWIVDLRSNMGGNMWPMIAGVGPLLGASPVGWFVRPTGEREPWVYDRGAGVYKGGTLAVISGAPYPVRNEGAPVAVLTNSNTVSAGEAVVVAFRGRPNTRSFGAPTGNKSTANEGFEMPDGASLFIATSVYADRNGQKYGVAIPPDEVISGASTEAASPNDSVALAARGWIESRRECARPTAQRQK
jgi:carboxyl-terminal processing protease